MSERKEESVKESVEATATAVEEASSKRKSAEQSDDSAKSKKAKEEEETMIATTQATTSLASLDDDVMLRLLGFLDGQSVGKLVRVNRLFKDKLVPSNPCWYRQVEQLCRELDDDDDNGKEQPRASGGLPADAAGVDWKKALAFYYLHKSGLSVYRKALNEHILLLGGRATKTEIQCSGTTTMKPELYVPAAGMKLSLPLDPAKLRALIDGNYCEQAPIGRGEETILDLKTRKGWRLMLGKDVLIGNQEWNADLTRAGFHVDSILHLVQEKLMPHTFGSGDVWAQPYCMLIYEKGDFFKPHRDTLRGPDHFGTLIVSLPVIGGSEGGRFVLTHNSSSSEEGRTVASHLPPLENEECKYFAFYTDVFHQVEPVTSGYRVALNYHLWAVPSHQSTRSIPRNIPATVDKSTTTLLQKLLKYGLEKHFAYRNEDIRYVFPLDHKYSQRTLRVFQLRGRDNVHYTVLEDSLSGCSVDVDLEELSVETFSKPSDPTLYRELTLAPPCNNGEGSKEDMGRASDQTVWLNQERFLAMEHEFAEYSYYTGNEGYGTDMKYEHACIVLAPSSFELHVGY